MKKIIFLCGARDFHAMDWYRSAKKKLGKEQVAVMADIISAEGMKSLVQEDDELIKLHILDKWLFKNPSRFGDMWRNALKLLVLPLQAKKLKKYYKQHPDTVYHAHGMYYMQVAAKAGVPFVGTPQGSELLVRPYRSNYYKKFATKALRAAKHVTVDSVNMQKSAENFSGVRPHIVQNGIDVKSILEYLSHTEQPERKVWLSMRGFTPLYREVELLKGRNASAKYSEKAISFVYPFFDEPYMEEAKPLMHKNDEVIGRLQRNDLYALMRKTEVVFSIPASDSSPRSVYESVFLGCPVIITANAYVDMLPKSMQKRIVVADIEEEGWFDKAVEQACEMAKKPYSPDEEAIDMFDQEACFDKVYKLLMS